MKNKYYRQSKMKKQLIQKRNEGLEFVVWKLNPTQILDIEELGYKVEPFIFLIETRTFYDIKKITSRILKDIHYAKKRKKCYLARTLKQREIESLDYYKIKYWPIKFKIYLQR